MNCVFTNDLFINLDNVELITPLAHNGFSLVMCSGKVVKFFDGEPIRTSSIQDKYIINSLANGHTETLYYQILAQTQKKFNNTD